MIFDRLEMLLKQIKGNANESVFEKLNQFLESDLEQRKPGRYEIEGDSIFAFVSEYETKVLEDTIIESHQRYIDIQLLVSGEERLDCFTGSSLEVKTPYNKQDDAAFYYRPEQVPASVILTPGVFVLFYPADLHSPQIAVKKSMPVKKVVVKIDRKLLMDADA